MCWQIFDAQNNLIVSRLASNQIKALFGVALPKHPPDNTSLTITVQASDKSGFQNAPQLRKSGKDQVPPARRAKKDQGRTRPDARRATPSHLDPARDSASHPATRRSAPESQTPKRRGAGANTTPQPNRRRRRGH